MHARRESAIVRLESSDMSDCRLTDTCPWLFVTQRLAMQAWARVAAGPSSAGAPQATQHAPAPRPGVADMSPSRRRHFQETCT